MWSGDSTTTPEELVDAVAVSGLDVVAITDHNTLLGALRFEASGELGIQVIVGQEIRTVSGDLIGLYMSERIPPGLRPLEAARRIRDQGGLVYAPHPGDDSRQSLGESELDDLAADDLLDVIEVLNAKRQNRYEGDLRGASPVGASDCHVPDALGAAYTEVPDLHSNDFDAADPASLLAALREGVVGGRYFDPPRAWSARIIPSCLLAQGP